MRIVIAGMLALLFAMVPAAADYGEDLCKKYMPPGTPCACVGEIFEEEFYEEELEPLLQFLRAFMAGLSGDEKASQKVIDQLAVDHGKKIIEDWLKRFEALSPQTEKACKFKF